MDKLDPNAYPALAAVMGAARRSKLDLYVDENVSILVEPLRLQGFKVRTVSRQGLSDREIQHQIEGDIIVTRNTRDFQYQALRLDYDIIDLSSLKFIDTIQTDQNQTAQQISRALIDSKISSVKGNFILKLAPDGTFSLDLIG